MNLPRIRGILALASLALVLAACAEDDPGGGDGVGLGQGGTGGTGLLPALVIDLAADVDRDGVVSPGGADEVGEDGWDETRGAIFLPNLDDDDDDGRVDGGDSTVDGAADLLDLSHLVVGPCAVADGATGVVELDAASEGSARLFRIDGPTGDPASYTSAGLRVELTAADLRAGATVALEGRTPVLSTEAGAWTGFVDVRLAVTDGAGALLGDDRVRLRVAPLLFQYNTAPTEAVFYSDSGRHSASLVEGLVPALAARGLAPVGLDVPGELDPWTQDFFDVAYVSRPGEGGEPVGMHVAIRSPQPDRAAGQIVTRHFLGPDFGAFYLHEPGGTDRYSHGYSMNSFGNWDVIPPHATEAGAFPLGRHVFGAGTSRDERPDPVYEDFVRAQAVQPAIEVDTTWLLVGHVDEFLQWVADPGPKGFRMLVGDPEGARELLLELQAAGHGDVPMFVGKYFYDFETEREYPAEVTVSETLADADRMAASQYARTIIDEEAARVAAETGLGDEDLTRMPFLFEELWGGMLAYQPGTVNLLHVDGVLVIADPFGPEVDGVDPFEADLETRLGAHGLEVHFADDWDLYHTAMGEVHCGTNVVRTMNQRWWESGR